MIIRARLRIPLLGRAFSFSEATLYEHYEVTEAAQVQSVDDCLLAAHEAAGKVRVQAFLTTIKFLKRSDGKANFG